MLKFSLFNFLAVNEKSINVNSVETAEKIMGAYSRHHSMGTFNSFQFQA